MITLNSYFEKLYCLNLDEATERWSKCMEQFKLYGISVERVSGIKPTTGKNRLLIGEVGVIRSQRKIIEDAKNKGYKNILIFEDDFKLADNFGVMFDKVASQIPSDWDYLYLGGLHLNKPIMISENIGKMTRTYETQTFAVKNTMYDKMLDGLKKELKPSDIVYSDLMPKCNAYVIRPHLSRQFDGYSFIQNKMQKHGD